MKLENNGTEIKLVYNQIEVGYIKYVESKSELSLDQLYIYPGFRRNGYAKMICEEFINYAKLQKKSIITDCWYFVEMFS